MVTLYVLVVLCFCLLLGEIVSEIKRDRYYRTRLDRHDAELYKLNKRIDHWFDIGKRKGRR